MLRLELKAGGISAAHEENVIARLRRDGMDHLKFLDFLVLSVHVSDQCYDSDVICCALIPS